MTQELSSVAATKKNCTILKKIKKLQEWKTTSVQYKLENCGKEIYDKINFQFNLE